MNLTMLRAGRGERFPSWKENEKTLCDFTAYLLICNSSARCCQRGLHDDWRHYSQMTERLAGDRWLYMEGICDGWTRGLICRTFQGWRTDLHQQRNTIFPVDTQDGYCVDVFKVTEISRFVFHNTPTRSAQSPSLRNYNAGILQV